MKNIIALITLFFCLLLSSSLVAQIPESKKIQPIPLEKPEEVQLFIDSLSTLIAAKASSEHYQLRALAYNKFRSFDKEYDDISKAISINPKNGMYYYQRAACEERRGNLVESKLDFTEAIKLMPNYVLAMSNLAEAYSKLGDKENTCLTLKRMADLGNEKAISYFEQYCK